MCIAYFFQAQENVSSTLLFLTEDDLKKVDEASFSYVDRLTKEEEGLYAKGFRIEENSILFDMAKFKQPSEAVIGLSRTSIKFTETIRILTKKYIQNRVIVLNSVFFKNIGCI